MTFIATAIGLGAGAAGIGGLTLATGGMLGATLGTGLASAYGANKQASAASNAADLQYKATQDAATQQREMFDILNAQQAPYRQAGQASLTKISDMMPYLTQQFGPEQLKSNLAPNYQFMLEQGLGAQNQALNVGGGGSNINTAGTKFAEDYASNAYQNAFNNFQTGRQNIYNTLAGIAGIGQTANTQTSQLGQNTAGNLGQLAVGGAQALGSGQIGAANAMAGGLQGIGNAGFLASMMRTPTTNAPTTNYGFSSGSTSLPDMGGAQGLQLRT